MVRLLEHKADVYAKAHNGWTALHWAAGNGHEAVVQLLLEHEADVHTGNGWTALYRASGNGHEAVVQLLQTSSRPPINGICVFYT